MVQNYQEKTPVTVDNINNNNNIIIIIIIINLSKNGPQ